MEAIDRLRSVLRVNALTSGAAGLACLALAHPVSRVLGPDRPGVVRLVGAGLVVFALDVAWVSRSRPQALVTGSRVAAAADAGWTLAMAGLALSGALDPFGIALVLASGVMTAELAWVEWAGARRAAATAPLQEAYA